MGAGSQRHLLPGREARKLSGQVDYDTPGGNDDACRQLKQPIPERTDLRKGTVTMARFDLDLLQDHVGSRCQEHAKLVREKTTTAGSIHREIVLQLLDPILGIAPPAVELVDILGVILRLVTTKRILFFGSRSG